MHFRREFGANSVFTLEGASDDEAYERFDTANRNRANPLFDAALSHSRLLKRIRNGEIVTIEVPELEESAKSENAEETNEPSPIESEATEHEGLGLSEDDLPLFALSTERKLYIYGASEAITLKPGWKLIVLRPTDKGT